VGRDSFGERLDETRIVHVEDRILPACFYAVQLGNALLRANQAVGASNPSCVALRHFLEDIVPIERHISPLDVVNEDAILIGWKLESIQVFPCERRAKTRSRESWVFRFAGSGAIERVWE
jgi:hypothetical protein